MSIVSLTQFGTLYHGSGKGFKGRVKPVSGTAFATPDLEEAKAYAARRAKQEGALFGPVYEVSVAPDDPAKSRTLPSIKGKGYSKYVMSKKGFDLGKIVAWG